MKLHAGIAILMAAICFLSGCETAGSAPDRMSVQPTPQQENQEKLQKALL